MQRKHIAIIGTGLIGGSLALQLNEKGLASRIIGVDNSVEHAKRALELGLVDEIMQLPEAIKQAEIIILAIPVDQLVHMLPGILDHVAEQVVIDLGSTKAQVLNSIKDHPRRGRYIAAHPMWGTEFSGPDAAVKGAFEEKAVILCDTEQSDADAVDWASSMFTRIGMHLLKMNAADHDLHAAYVSHISHLTSFALANTVLEKEKEDDAIFELASAGFESTVRLAKSSADMWVPIFRQNRENVLDVLNEHISQLRKFKSCLEKENYDYMYHLIGQANTIRKVLNKEKRGKLIEGEND